MKSPKDRMFEDVQEDPNLLPSMKKEAAVAKKRLAALVDVEDALRQFEESAKVLDSALKKHDRYQLKRATEGLDDWLADSVMMVPSSLDDIEEFADLPEIRKHRPLLELWISTFEENEDELQEFADEMSEWSDDE